MIQTFVWCSATSRWKNFDLNNSQFFRGHHWQHWHWKLHCWQCIECFVEVTIVFDGFSMVSGSPYHCVRWFLVSPTIMYDGCPWLFTIAQCAFWHLTHLLWFKHVGCIKHYSTIDCKLPANSCALWVVQWPCSQNGPVSDTKRRRGGYRGIF